MEPYLKNVIFGFQKTPENIYDWKDINIQGGWGDTIIDLSNTVLPKGEAVILIRHLIGNIQILVPYETELSVHHSVLLGSTMILKKEIPSSFNQTMYYYTPEYETAEQKIKIVTSIISGDLEVKRI